MIVRLTLAGILMGTAVLACSIGGETYVAVTEAAATEADDASAPAPAAGNASGAACTGKPFAKPDLAKLKACESGGHCYEKAKVPPQMQALFLACAEAGQVCVPDEILTAGGEKLKACKQPDSVKAVAGEGGGCTNIALLPEVKKQAGAFLRQQECGAEQVCIPCKNPQDGTATPFCQPIGVYDSACAGGAGAADASTASQPPSQPCCTSNGKSNGACMPATVLPPDKAGSMPQDVCARDAVCMPAAMLQGTAKRCDAGLLFGSGVCMDKCFNPLLRIAGFVGALHTEGCGETEVCAPCSVLEKQVPAGLPVPGCR